MDCSTFAFDLHVLGTPPALILSQDQTLMLNSRASQHLYYLVETEAPTRLTSATHYTEGRLIGSALFNPYLV